MEFKSNVLSLTRHLIVLQRFYWCGLWFRRNDSALTIGRKRFDCETHQRGNEDELHLLYSSRWCFPEEVGQQCDPSWPRHQKPLKDNTGLCSKDGTWKRLISWKGRSAWEGMRMCRRSHESTLKEIQWKKVYELYSFFFYVILLHATRGSTGQHKLSIWTKWNPGSAVVLWAMWSSFGLSFCFNGDEFWV